MDANENKSSSDDDFTQEEMVVDIKIRERTKTLNKKFPEIEGISKTYDRNNPRNYVESNRKARS